MKLRLTLAIAFAALLLAAGGAVASGRWSPWAHDYVQGVDVSHHQGAIDWRALAQDGVRFAYIKATEGGDHVDTRFAMNWRDAQNAGVAHGAYHFFTLCRSADAQAANFIANVPNDPAMLPPAVDLEHMGPCRENAAITDVAAEARRFLDLVQLHYGVRPILYVTREFHDAHLADFRGECFWVRSLYSRPDFRQQDWVIWQHHNRGSKRGVTGPIDLNAFRGDEAAFAAFANPHQTNPQTGT
ncbi:MAG: GH25 family lysozyme [Caulobacterales bacterium]